MLSIYEMLMALVELRSYCDLTEWEDSFIESIDSQVKIAGGTTIGLSDRQTDKIEQLYHKHTR